MKEGKPREVHNFLGLFGLQEDLLEINIFDLNGKVLRTSKKKEEGIPQLLLTPLQFASAKNPLILEQEMFGRPFLTSIQTLHKSAHVQSKDNPLTPLTSSQSPLLPGSNEYNGSIPKDKDLPRK